MRRPSAFQRLIHRFLALQPVSAFFSRSLHRADSFMFHLTGGRHTFAEFVGLPIAQVTMKGAKTGMLRTLPLVSVPDDRKLVLIATNFGQKHNPGWYYNLKAHPECEVSYNGECRKFIARETADEEYQKYWQLALTYYIGYDIYQQRAAPRHIPVLILEPKQ
ncbi:MAG TPA: nitroreductase family deazaflavin-dependent oxidoreductase [Anaerolineales bacterium]|nr:nitroreductase family deazaflavin-dependent oxidoreductase [Anaerolineales bacterium]